MDERVQERRRAARPADPLLAFVVPVFNEEDSVAEFHRRITEVTSDLDVRVELLFVNDGSTDRTLEKLFELADRDERVRIVNLSRNFGKEAALTAGLQHCTGDAVVPIDVDLQDPPELLAAFLDKWRSGYDVVYGVRTDRSSEPFSKRASAAIFYRLFNALSPTPIPRNVGDFRMIDRRVVDHVLELDERNRFMKGIFAWVGFPTAGVEYERPKRALGQTSWTPWKLWNFALDGITAFSTLPLRIWTYFGMAVGALCVLYAGFIATLAISGRIDGVPGYASLIVVILFLGATQLISLGLLGEYVSRVLAETKRRPIYLLEGVYEGAPRPQSSVDDREVIGGSARD